MLIPNYIAIPLILLFLVGVSFLVFFIVDSNDRAKREAKAAAKFSEFMERAKSRAPQESELLNQIHDDLHYGKSEAEIYSSLQTQGYSIGAIADAMRAYKTFLNPSQKK